MATPLEVILDYHERTKHRPGAYARSPGRLGAYAFVFERAKPGLPLPRRGRAYTRKLMTKAKPGAASAAAMLAAVLVLLVVVPAVMSLANGDGTICFADSACPLAAVNPCVRKPSFAVVGRCAAAIK